MLQTLEAEYVIVFAVYAAVTAAFYRCQNSEVYHSRWYKNARERVWGRRKVRKMSLDQSNLFFKIVWTINFWLVATTIFLYVRVGAEDPAPAVTTGLDCAVYHVINICFLANLIFTSWYGCVMESRSHFLKHSKGNWLLAIAVLCMATAWTAEGFLVREAADRADAVYFVAPLILYGLYCLWLLAAVVISVWYRHPINDEFADHFEQYRNPVEYVLEKRQ